MRKFRVLIFFFSQITRMACVGIAVYIMLVTKSVDIANIIITPEKHFTKNSGHNNALPNNRQKIMR